MSECPVLHSSYLREGSTAIKTEPATFTLTASEAKGQYRLGL